MKEYTVYLFKAPECIRGWLAYLSTYKYVSSNPDRIITVKAENGSKARNIAITLINKKETDNENIKITN